MQRRGAVDSRKARRSKGSGLAGPTDARRPHPLEADPAQRRIDAAEPATLAEGTSAPAALAKEPAQALTPALATVATSPDTAAATAGATSTATADLGAQSGGNHTGGARQGDPLPPQPPAPLPATLQRGSDGWNGDRLAQLLQNGSVQESWLPNMRAAAPTHLQIQNAHQRELLRFSNAIANTGANNLQVRRGTPLDPNSSDPNDQALIATAVSLGLDPSAVALTSQELLRPDGTRAAVIEDAALSEYHPEHRHFHIGETAAFSLERYDASDQSWDPITGIGVTKTTFCLIDVNRIEQLSGDLFAVVKSPTNAKVYNDCFADVQGIQAGWIDRYSHSLPGQQLDITNLEAGIYRLLTIVNPSQWFLESRFDDNVGWTSFRLGRDSQGNASLHDLKSGIAGAPDAVFGGIVFDQSSNGMG